MCGVSGSIAIAGAVGAKKEHAPIAITMVILWAIVMIFFLPLVSRALHLHTGVAGAWIGTSEFADAAGFAAAQAYGNLAGHVPGIAGTQDAAVWGFTLMKVVGRDIWIGIWAFVLALIATTRWEVKAGSKPEAAEIWWRFPKFVIGFVVASIFITIIASHFSFADYNKIVKPQLRWPHNRSAYLGLYLLLFQHRPDHPLPGIGQHRRQTLLGFHRWCGGQCGAGLRSVG